MNRKSKTEQWSWRLQYSYVWEVSGVKKYVHKYDKTTENLGGYNEMNTIVSQA